VGQGLVLDETTTAKKKRKKNRKKKKHNNEASELKDPGQAGGNPDLIKSRQFVVEEVDSN